MCGIAGFLLHRAGSISNPETVVEKMTDRLAHRGPDGVGLHCDLPAFLGHRRLSIIDHSGGAQPMVSDNASVVSFNGEIYNFYDIREKLEETGCRFKTNSDTEVLLAAFEAYRESCIHHFNGMFAFAIWCPKERRLFLARDRLGKKPLYYVDSPAYFAFASELKALKEIPELAKSLTVDFRSVSDFLSLGYVLQPKTIFREISQLDPGCYAWVEAGKPGISRSSFWESHEAYLDDKLPNAQSTRDDFLNLLNDSVRLRLNSDVPVATFLSGGIDSAAILASVSSQVDEPPTALNIGFREPSFDERKLAETTASRLNARYVQLEHSDADDLTLEKLIETFDEPFSDTSSLPMDALTEMASQSYKVVLSGDGADELLAGYPSYRADQYYKTYMRVPNALQVISKKLADAILKPSYAKVSFDYKLRQFLGSSGLSPKQAHYWWRVVFSDDEKRQLLNGELQSSLGSYSPYTVFDDHFNTVKGASFLNQTLYVDLKTWLLSDILVKVDRSSMSHGLEVRSPFLDYRLVEFCARLPDEMKMKGASQKLILKEVFKNNLPPRVITGKKRGFNAPTNSYALHSLSEIGAGCCFDRKFTLNPAHEDISFKGFSLRILDLWMRMHDNSAAGTS